MNVTIYKINGYTLHQNCIRRHMRMQRCSCLLRPKGLAHFCYWVTYMSTEQVKSATQGAAESCWVWCSAWEVNRKRMDHCFRLNALQILSFGHRAGHSSARRHLGVCSVACAALCADDFFGQTRLSLSDALTARRRLRSPLFAAGRVEVRVFWE